MYAICFDMAISDLKQHYGELHNNAHFEIKKTLRPYEFYNTHGSVFLCKSSDMANLFKALSALKKIDWFKDSVRDIRAFRVESWSNFTAFFQEEL